MLAVLLLLVLRFIFTNITNTILCRIVKKNNSNKIILNIKFLISQTFCFKVIYSQLFKKSNHFHENIHYVDSVKCKNVRNCL